MKAILEFKLPEERDEYDITIKAGEYHSRIHDALHKIRGRLKHGTPGEDEVATLEELRDILWIDE